MCRVTYIPGPGGIWLSSNRDEKASRGAALAPCVYTGHYGRLLYPKDPDGGGSWIAVHTLGHALVFLNGAFKKHITTPPYRLSRGRILLEMIDQPSPITYFQEADLRGIEAFTAVLLESGQLLEARWDGNRKFRQILDGSRPHIWSSVTLYDELTAAKTAAQFSHWCQHVSNPGQEAISAFHLEALRNTDPDLSTVSISSLFMGRNNCNLHYMELPGQKSLSCGLGFSTLIPEAL